MNVYVYYVLLPHIIFEMELRIYTYVRGPFG